MGGGGGGVGGRPVGIQKLKLGLAVIFPPDTYTCWCTELVDSRFTFTCFFCSLRLAGVSNSDHVLRRRNNQSEAAVPNQEVGRGRRRGQEALGMSCFVQSVQAYFGNK